ncbi:MAG TPA: aldo/keto reductase [Bacteroidales bacterium]|nr:aldo/keto reductase [Bacteroidales bacterium]
MKKITRKEFIKKSGTGAAAIGLMPQLLSVRPQDTYDLRPLGNTGMMVSPICFGAARTMDEGLIRYALDRGINFLDTGRSYGNGNNERLVGRVIEGNRTKVIVQSKQQLEESWLSFKGKGKRGHDEITDILNRGLDETLTALKSDHVDVYLYHSAELEYLTFHEAVLKFFTDQKSAGRIRASGFSSHDYELKLLIRNNREKAYDVIMHPINFSGGFTHSLSGWTAKWDQEVLLEQLEYAASIGTGIVAMKTCSAGPLPTGENGEASFRNAVSWVLSHKFISSAAIAMPSIEQLEEHTG